jgi:hypothetical protein
MSSSLKCPDQIVVCHVGADLFPLSLDVNTPRLVRHIKRLLHAQNLVPPVPALFTPTVKAITSCCFDIGTGGASTVELV